MKKTAIVCIIALAGLLLANVASADEALYKAKCASCHGEDGSANTAIGQKMKLRDLRSPDVQKMSDKELFEIIAVGGAAKKASHAYKAKGLSDAQVNALVAHIRKLATK
jgi:mono/diheme cytochrome c family protein